MDGAYWVILLAVAIVRPFVASAAIRDPTFVLFMASLKVSNTDWMFSARVEKEHNSSYKWGRRSRITSKINSSQSSSSIAISFNKSQALFLSFFLYFCALYLIRGLPPIESDD